MTVVRLMPGDPTIFAKCPKCTRRGPGARLIEYFGKAYTARDWAKGPECENCHTPMERFNEVRSD